MINETHDAALKSWVESAQTADSDFPIQNLPFGVFRRRGSQEHWRGGVAIGDQIVDLAAAAKSARSAFPHDANDALQAAAQDALNDLMGLGPAAWSALRLALSRALRAGSSAEALLRHCLVAQTDAEFHMPARVGDYTDFYTSIHHATHIGSLFRPDNPLMPNYKWIPIGYHGRSSSVIVSGRDFKRPVGQVKPAGADAPVVRASQRMDIELELGVFIGAGNALGEPIPMTQAEDHVFGFVLLNDWSARDIQPWEYQPLGPFLAKNFATTISPWIVTTEALAPYRTAPPERPAGDPAPLAYLDSPARGERGAIDMQLEILLQTPKMKQAGTPPASICLTNYQYAYWTFEQLVAHHTVNGCNLRPGDLLGTGTLSGPNPGQAAALIEITHGGKNPIQLPNGEKRTFLEDGDTVILRGWCQKAGAPRIGLGECRGTVLPARSA
jgi:fumarylacetoacetase